MTAPVTDRRQRRRQETIEEVLDVALDLMAEHGVAGLSLGEVARRMGMRTPSLYVYFDSKNALYDALFARGAELVLEQVRGAVRQALDDDGSLEDALLAVGEAMTRWVVSHQPYAQLLFWRTVPGFTPSAEAYAPAVALYDTSRDAIAELQRRGRIRADAVVDDVMRDWTIVTAGVASQQLANGPDETYESGRFTSALPDVVAMFAHHYAP